MTTSNEAIAAAREIFIQKFITPDPITEIASIIQKHYAAKDAEIDQIKIDIAEIRRQHQQEANEWKTDEELTQERDQLKARVAELESALRLSHDKMFSWFSSEYANHPDTRKVERILNPKCDACGEKHTNENCPGLRALVSMKTGHQKEKL